MLSKLKKYVLPLVFWLAVWNLCSSYVKSSFLLPSIDQTFIALFELLKTEAFYKAVIFSTLRVIIGFVLGCILGVVLSVVCKKIALINDILSPMITVIRSTPVASFIIVLWLLMDGNVLSVFIGFLMVMPIIWQSTNDAIDAIDGGLLEVAKVYEFSKKKTFMLLILPTLKKFLLPAIVSSSGLAWKAEIAAEIIVYTKNSIGQGINNAKSLMETPTVFAWTLVIIVFSIFLEKGTKLFLGRVKK